MPLTPEDEELLPQYTLGERSRELRQRSVMLCWLAQRLRNRSAQLRHPPARAVPCVPPPVDGSSIPPGPPPPILTKTMTRHRAVGAAALVLLVLGLSRAPLAVARRGEPGSISPRVVATIIALAPRGMVTIRTVDGRTYDVLKGASWHVGDTVECEQYDRMGQPSWETLECRKTS